MSRTSASLSGSSSLPQGDGKRALIVNEEPWLRRILPKAVRRMGYFCTVAATGVDGVTAVGQGGFDLVLTDLLMQGMSGLDLIVEARKVMPEAAIVAVTGVAGIKMCLEALRQGADAYVVIPFGIEQIGYAIDWAEERRRLLGTEAGRR